MSTSKTLAAIAFVLVPIAALSGCGRDEAVWDAAKDQATIACVDKLGAYESEYSDEWVRCMKVQRERAYDEIMREYKEDGLR